jgi:hypothetical protein
MASSSHATVAWKLPVGVQDFAQLREGGFLYADKTPLIHRLATTGLAYVLSRPRRFGKSLLLSTIKELYEGKEPLFRGLWIHDHWDWTRRHPVVLLSLGTGGYQEPGAARSISPSRSMPRRSGTRWHCGSANLPSASPSSCAG